MRNEIGHFWHSAVHSEYTRRQELSRPRAQGEDGACFRCQGGWFATPRMGELEHHKCDTPFSPHVARASSHQAVPYQAVWRAALHHDQILGVGVAL